MPPRPPRPRRIRPERRHREPGMSSRGVESGDIPMSPGDGESADGVQQAVDESASMMSAHCRYGGEEELGRDHAILSECQNPGR